MVDIPLEKFDVAIIGAGTIGLFCAWKLSSSGRKVIVLERGGVKNEYYSNDFNFSRSVYSGATRGRMTGLGGTSAIWGGALIPSQQEDFKRFYENSMVEDLLSGISDVESFFALPEASYERTDDNLFPISKSCKIRSAKWAGVKNKNSFFRIKKLLKSTRMPEIILEARVLEWIFESGRIVAARYLSQNGREYQVTFDQLLVTCGALGNVQIIADIFRQAGIDTPKELGKHLSDHLSVPILELRIPRNLESLFSRQFGQRFVSGTSRRDFRIESSWKDSYDQPAFFLHFSQVGTGAFRIFRKLLESLSGGPRITIQESLRFLATFPTLLRMLYYVLRYRTLQISSTREITVYCVIEKLISEKCRIDGFATQQDSNSPLTIHWEILEEDISAVVNVQDSIYADLRNIFDEFRISIKKLEIMKPTQGNYEGIYHPTGVTRSDSKDGKGVVSQFGKLHSFTNVYAVSTGNLPRSGGTNPTMNALLIANLACLDMLRETT